MNSFLVFLQSMELVGGNEMKLSPSTTGNITYVFPNKVSLVTRCKDHLDKQ